MRERAAARRSFTAERSAARLLPSERALSRPKRALLAPTPLPLHAGASTPDSLSPAPLFLLRK